MDVLQLCDVPMNIHPPAVTCHQPAGAKTVSASASIQFIPRWRKGENCLLANGKHKTDTENKMHVFLPNTFPLWAPVLLLGRREMQNASSTSNLTNLYQTTEHTHSQTSSELPAIKANLITDHKAYQA